MAGGAGLISPLEPEFTAGTAAIELLESMRGADRSSHFPKIIFPAVNSGSSGEIKPAPPAIMAVRPAEQG